MIKPEESQALGVAQQHRNRAHTRRKLSPMAYVELGNDNGGILLNLSEGGFAVQSALALTSRDFTGLRFQVPQVQGWLTASGKIAWISDSKKEAGIQFTQLPAQARVAIQKWVSSEEHPAPAVDAVARKSPDRKADIFSAPARIPTEPVAVRERENGKKPLDGQAPRARPEPSGNISPAIAAPPAVIAPTPVAPPTAVAPESATAAHDFRFTDYSMFSAEPEREHPWARPEKKGVGWGTLTLLGLGLSGLFFVLGAILGRGRVEQWITATTGWQMQRAAQTPTADAAPQHEVPSTEANDQQQSSSGSASSGNETSSPESPSAAESKAPDTNSGSPVPGNTAAAGNTAASPSTSRPEPNSSAKADRENNEVAAAKKDPGIAARNNTSGKGAGAGTRSSRGDESYPRTPQPKSYDDIGAGPPISPGEHAILVNAPPPGSPPFSVNLSSDAVSASSTVAIAAQHSMVVGPRSGSYGTSQRVVIGKLVTHAEPFYPADARSKQIQGSVLLHVTIGRTGHVIAVSPVRGPAELVKAATTAVRDWRYEPTYVEGDPVETQADVTFVFRLP